MMALTVQTQISGDVFILGCNGRIVFGDEGAVLRERVGSMLPGTPKIVVNLDGVDYIDSGGLGILVGLLVSARNRGGELKLVSPRERVKDVLRNTNLDRIFRVYANNDEAVAAFRKRCIPSGYLLFAEGFDRLVVVCVHPEYSVQIRVSKHIPDALAGRDQLEFATPVFS